MEELYKTLVETKKLLDLLKTLTTNYGAIFTMAI